MNTNVCIHELTTENCADCTPAVPIMQQVTDLLLSEFELHGSIYGTVSMMAERYGVSYYTVYRAINELNESFGNKKRIIYSDADRCWKMTIDVNLLEISKLKSLKTAATHLLTAAKKDETIARQYGKKTAAHRLSRANAAMAVAAAEQVLAMAGVEAEVEVPINV